MPLPLELIFPDEDHRFHLTLRKGDLSAFFQPCDPPALAERSRWFDHDANPYAIAREGAEPLLSDFEAFARENITGPLSLGEGRPLACRVIGLGRALEPDTVFLAKDGAGVFRVCAGAVCFPSSWALTEKMGRTLEEIHGVVPELNSSLGLPISQFLQKLKTGTAYERSNWGLAATPERNMHPALQRPRLAPPFDPERIWVRIEDQILAAISASGLVFGIRLRVFPLVQLLANRALRTGFHRALLTMPMPLATYKGITPIHGELLKSATDPN